MKKIISACIDQVILFDEELELERFINHLKSRKQKFRLVTKEVKDDGKVLVRIKRQYNNHFMEEDQQPLQILKALYESIPVEQRNAIFGITEGGDGSEQE